MAPELHTGGRPGTTTDVYSLGCLLWATLVGRAPYGGTTDYELASAHVSAPIPQLAATGPFEREVNRILRTAMAKHPGERYAAAAALRDDLRRVIRSFPAPASVAASSLHERPTQPLGRPLAPTPVPAAPASYAPYSPGHPPSAAPTGPASAGLFVAIVVGLVLLVVVGVVGGVIALRGGDGEVDSGSDAESSLVVDTSTTRRPVDTGPTGDDGLTRDERRAADNIAAALRDDPNFTGLDAQCTARKLVMQKGIDQLQDQGVLDEDLDFVADTNPAVNAQLFTDLISISVSCAFESVTFGVTPS
jgi:serine/threonine-protein kinase